jgi:hypothetical protein
LVRAVDIPVKIVLAIITALALLGSLFVVASPTLAAQACCGKCAGQCCLKDSSAPLAPQPLAPASAPAAPNVELLLAGSLTLEIPSARFAPPLPVRLAPPFASARPLFQRHCVYLI